MYRLSKKQHGPKCTFCKTERATHRTKYFAEYSCMNQECLDKAYSAEQHREASENNLTEADYQTWNRI